MDEIEIIPVGILRENYERKISDLIDALLDLDEKLFEAENQDSRTQKEAA